MVEVGVADSFAPGALLIWIIQASLYSNHVR